MVGNWVSLTVTVVAQVLLFPAASDAMTVNIVVPTGKKLPGAWLL